MKTRFIVLSGICNGEDNLRNVLNVILDIRCEDEVMNEYWNPIIRRAALSTKLLKDSDKIRDVNDVNSLELLFNTIWKILDRCYDDNTIPGIQILNTFHMEWLYENINILNDDKEVNYKFIIIRRKSNYSQIISRLIGKENLISAQFEHIQHGSIGIDLNKVLTITKDIEKTNKYLDLFMANDKLDCLELQYTDGSYVEETETLKKFLGVTDSYHCAPDEIIPFKMEEYLSKFKNINEINTTIAEHQ